MEQLQGTLYFVVASKILMVGQRFNRLGVDSKRSKIAGYASRSLPCRQTRPSEHIREARIVDEATAHSPRNRLVHNVLREIVSLEAFDNLGCAALSDCAKALYLLFRFLEQLFR